MGRGLRRLREWGRGGPGKACCSAPLLQCARLEAQLVPGPELRPAERTAWGRPLRGQRAGTAEREKGRSPRRLREDPGEAGAGQSVCSASGAGTRASRAWETPWGRHRPAAEARWPRARMERVSLGRPGDILDC